MDRVIPKSGTLLHIYRLQNSNAEDLAKVLMNLPKDSKDPAQKGKSPVLSKDINIISDKATNTLVITAERADYLILEDVIKKLDTPRPMVYIEALIMEVSVNKDFKLGVEWTGVKDTGAITGLSGADGNPARSGAFIRSGGSGTVMPSYDLTTGAVSLASGFSLGILGAGIKIGDVLFPNIGAVLQAYQTDQDVSILSTPQLLTIDNEEAEINVGENRPYLTRQETTSTTSTDYSTYEYKDVGIILKILPHINEDGFVRLKVDQQVTRVVSATESTRPVTRKRTAKTTVVVKDGETVVIGGLVGDSTDSTTYKVPCLGSIPLLGWLFKTMARNKEKTNLFVFITPRIVRNQQDAAAISAEKQDVMGEVKDGVIKMTPKKAKPKQEEGK
jgi:general secretion pathway protein D